MEKCYKCGQEAILNENRECFDCAALNVKKKKKSNKMLKGNFTVMLWIIMTVVNIIVTYQLLGKYHVKTIWCMIYLGIAIVGSIIQSVLDYLQVEKLKYMCWQTPAGNMILKLVIMPIYGNTYIPYHVSSGFDSGAYQAGWAFKFLLVLLGIFIFTNIIFMQVKGVLQHKLTPNAILGIENELPDLHNIPQYEKVIDKEYVYQELNKEIDNTIHLIRNSDMEDDMKEEIISLIKRRDDFEVNNEVRYQYCNIMEQCMENAFRRDDNGDWVDEIKLDYDNYWFDLKIPESFGQGKDKYVTRKLFELSERMKKEIVQNQNCFLQREAAINPTYWFGEFRKDCMGTSLGEKGEQRVAQELKPYEGQIIVLPNLRLEVEGESVENDFVLISPYGIYILEVKNLGSTGSFGLHIEKDGRWSKVYDHREETMGSPVHQNERHILYLEKHINEKLGRKLDDYLRIQGMVVIANDRVNITNESNHLIVRCNNIMSTIRNMPIIMKEEEMIIIANVLSEAGLPPKKYPIPNYFNTYFNAKLLKKDYLEWKVGTEELKNYAKLYNEQVITQYS